MEYYHPKVVDTSVLFIRKNGSKMKLKNLADKLLNVILCFNSEKNPVWNTLFERRLSGYSTFGPGKTLKLKDA
jgi:hypothetical protein